MKKISFLFIISIFTLLLSSCNLVDGELLRLQDENKLLSEQINELENEYNQVFDDIVETSETARQSNIYITTTLTFNRFGLWETKKGGQGSGFIYKKDENYYYALTNFHVINKENANEVEYKVKFSSGVEVEGTVISQGDDVLDLAVIRFPISNQVVSLTNINTELKIYKNEFALVVGNPAGLQNVVTPTKIIDYGVFLRDIEYPVLVFSYSMDAHGNSGGAVVDINGNLLGILTWQGQEEPDKKFAIPIDIIYDYLTSNELI